MGHNGGFNPFRDRNGEFTTPEGSGKPGRSRAGGAAGASTLPARAASAATRGARFQGRNGKLPAEVGTGQAGWGDRTRKGPQYRTRADVAATRAAPIADGRKLSLKDRATAAKIVNTYAGRTGQKVDKNTSSDAELLRRLRSTSARSREIMRGDESEFLADIERKLTAPKTTRAAAASAASARTASSAAAQAKSSAYNAFVSNSLSQVLSGQKSDAQHQRDVAAARRKAGL